MADERKALRELLRERRRAIPARERLAAADCIALRLRSLPFAPTRGHVAGYWAMDGEIALHAWQLGLPASVNYCLPVLSDDGSLRFAPWRPGASLVSNRFGIPEPDVADDALIHASEMQLVAVPLVGFDHHLQRLGMGGGWYDRTFAFRAVTSAPPWLVGVGFAAQQVDEGLAPRAWDVALDAVCTEQASMISPSTKEPT